MKLKYCILIFCFGIFSLGKAQSRFPVLNPDHFVYLPKSFSLKASSQFDLKKDLSMKYRPAPLPFFCSMEEKSRDKFHLFIKLRAGNDESYMKMINPSDR